MKVRRFFFILLVFFLVVLLIACDSEPTNEVSNVSTDVILIVPGIDTDTSKGLINFPLENFNTVLQQGKTGETKSIGLGGSIMSYLPVIPTVKSVVVKNFLSTDKKALLNSLKASLDFEIYGFIGSINLSKSSINSDGIYLYYECFEPTRPNNSIGIIEYYYNFITKKLSYREYIMNNSICGQDDNGKPLYQDSVLMVQLDDVLYDFTSGSFTTNGENALSVNLAFTELGGFFEGMAFLNVRRPVMKSKNHEVCFYTLPELERCYGAFDLHWGGNEEDKLINRDLRLAIAKAILGPKYDTISEDEALESLSRTSDKRRFNKELIGDARETLNGQDAVNIFKIMFKNEKIGIGNVKSYEEFKAGTLGYPYVVSDNHKQIQRQQQAGYYNFDSGEGSSWRISFEDHSDNNQYFKNIWAIFESDNAGENTHYNINASADSDKNNPKKKFCVDSHNTEAWSTYYFNAVSDIIDKAPSDSIVSPCSSNDRTERIFKTLYQDSSEETSVRRNNGWYEIDDNSGVITIEDAQGNTISGMVIEFPDFPICEYIKFVNPDYLPAYYAFLNDFLFTDPTQE